MKAEVVTSFDQPLEILDLPVPTPEPNEVLVRIEASGLCHTVIKAESRKLDEVNTSMDEVLAGQVPARLVFGF